MSILNSLALCAGLIVLAQQSIAADTTLKAVDRVDLRRYAGRWYEIARYPNRFQRDCKSDTTAEYVLRDNGKIQVINACRKEDGTITTARGTARVVDTTTNSKLKVTFFWPFYGNYWIIGLSTNYDYAIVGEPNRKYLWILSRTPNMDEGTYGQILEQIRSAGYDPARLQRTQHSNGGD
jgi:apolipoprotein D and lipocalin family protein